MPQVLKLQKFCNVSQEGNVLHTSTYISAVHFNAIELYEGDVYLVNFLKCQVEHHGRVAQKTQNLHAYRGHII